MTEWVVIWVAAIVATIIGLGTLFHFSYIARVWPKTKGRVTGNVAEFAHHDSGRSTVYFPEIAFIAADGKGYTVKGDVGLNAPWSIGQTIELHYKTKNPMHAMTLKPWQRLAFSGTFIFFATMSWGVISGIIER